MVRIRDIMKGLGAVYAALYGFYALAQSGIARPVFEDIQNPQIQETTGAYRQKINWFRNSVPYLVEDAHKITNRFIKKNSLDIETLEESLNKREGHCKWNSIITYSNFRYLSKKINPDCINDVRLSWGQTIQFKFPFIVGHGWIEMKEGSEWVPYETTRIKTGTEARKIAGVLYVPCESIGIDKNGREEHSFRWGKVLEPIIFSFKLFGTTIYKAIN
jgi:hypothetical protein